MFEPGSIKKNVSAHDRRSGVEVFDFTSSDPDDDAGEISPDYNRRRFLIFIILLFSAIGVLFFRTAYLQINQSSYYQQFSESNRTRTKIVKAPRGVFYDKNLNQLSTNIPSFDLTFIPLYLPKEEEKQKEVAQKLSSLISDINPEEILERFNKKDYSSPYPQLILEGITRDQTLIVESHRHELPGIQIEIGSRREYPEGHFIAHLLGYDGKITAEEIEKYPDYLLTDNVGKTGLEKSYESELHGAPGGEKYEVDSQGEIKKHLGKTHPVPGNNLQLHLDLELQKKLYATLQTILKDIESERAIAVAINPQNGGVLASISLPSYDNNLFSGGISTEDYKTLSVDEDHPLLNRAISGEYPPGSTFKLIVGSAALQEGLVHRHTSFNSTGGIEIDKWYFPDWKEGGHGQTDITKAISESVNTYFYYISGGHDDFRGLGIKRITDYARQFGLDQPTNVDIPGERTGFLPSKEWKEEVKKEPWYVGDTYHAGIGQGDILVTPLQLANMVASIANGGVLYKPQFVNKTLDQNQQEITNFQPEIANQGFIDSANLQIIREGMRSAVMTGSAKALADLPFTVAGKTGTAQAGGDRTPHSWFASFAPYDNPEIALVILVENGGESTDAAVPVARDVLNWYFSQR